MRRIFSFLLAALCLTAAAQNNGTVVGSPTFGPVQFGNGLTSTSDSNYITLPAATAITGAATVEARIKTTTTAYSIAVTLGTTVPAFIAVYTNGHFVVAYSGFSGGIVDSGITINDGAVHHCAFTINSALTLLSTYCDGVAGATGTGTGGTLSGAGAIGRFSAATGFAWPGSIDEVAIWNIVKYSGTYTVPTSAYTGTEAGLVALYHLQADGTDSKTSSSSTNTIDPSSAGILYSPFNWNVATGSAKTINELAYFRTIFTGTSAALTFSMTNATTPYSQFWCRIDNQGFAQYTMAATVALATGLASRGHLLECVVKSITIANTKWSATSQGMLTLTGLVLDGGGTVSLPTRRSKNCLLFGDSISAGIRAINNTAASDTDQDDGLGAYSYLALTATDCEWGIVGFGAQGLSVGGVGGVPALPSAYNYIYSGVARSFSSPAPDLIVFNQGQNDGSTNITSAYTSLLNAVLTASPSSRLLVLRPFTGAEAANVQAAVTAVASSKVAYVDTTGWFNTADSTDAVHPYSYSSYGLIGPKLLPFINGALAAAARSTSFF